MILTLAFQCKNSYFESVATFPHHHAESARPNAQAGQRLLNRNQYHFS